MGMLHQNTAQAIQKHFDDLFTGNGNYSYASPAATTLLETHTTYQQYFTNVLVDHAYTQGTRHSTLTGHVSDYLGQMPGKVYNLSPPMAALGALGLETMTARVASGGSPTTLEAPSDAPPQWLADAIQWGETTEQNLDEDAGGTPPGPENPWWDILVGLMIIVGVILVLLAICWGIWWLWDHLTSHQNQQKNTSTPTPPAKPTPTPTPTPTKGKPVHTPTPDELKEVQSLAAQYGIDPALLIALLEEGYTLDEIRTLLTNLAQNARTDNSTQKARYMTRQLQALINHWNNMTDDQYAILRKLGYTDEQIRQMFMANLISVDNVIVLTESVQADGVYASLRAEGYTDEEIHRMLMAGLTEEQLKVIAQRSRKTPELREMFNRIINALLSGDSGKRFEAQVALCILDQVTRFDEEYKATKPGLQNGQIDVGTDTTIIEVKQPNAKPKGTTAQISNIVANFPGTSVILYAPGYNAIPTQNALNAGAKAVVGSCQELHAKL